MAKILQDVSERIKGVEESAKRGKEAARTAQKVNGLRKNKQLSSLLDSVDNNAADTTRVDNADVEKLIRKSNFTSLLASFFGTAKPSAKKLKKVNKAKKNDELVALIERLNANTATDSDTSGTSDDSGKQQEARKPKQLIDSKVDIEKTEANSTPPPKPAEPVKPVETCEDKPQLDSVQVVF